MGVNSLPKTVTRQRHGCDLNPGPSAPESSTLTTRLPSHPLCRVRPTKRRSHRDRKVCDVTSSYVCISENEASAAVFVRVVRSIDGQFFAVDPELTVKVIPTVWAFVDGHWTQLLALKNSTHTSKQPVFNSKQIAGGSVAEWIATAFKDSSVRTTASAP